MNLKLLSVVFVILAPGVAVAAGCNHEEVTATMSCAADKVFDQATKSCVPVTG